MKILRYKNLRQTAFTLIEIMVSTGIVTIAGTGIFLALQSGLNLFAKNTSVNIAHQQLLKAVQRITRDAHAAVDVPELLDASFTVVAAGPAAGVSFQIPWQKPFKMTTGGAGGTAKITIDTNSAGATPSPRPSAGQRAYLPGNDNTEDDIKLVAANGTNSAYSDITFQNNLWKNISPNSGSYIRPVVIVDKIAYVVNTSGELHFYTRTYSGGAFSWLDRGVRARYITSLVPFNLVNNRTVTGNFSVGDPAYNNRGFKATNMSLTFQAPYRTKVAIF